MMGELKIPMLLLSLVAGYGALVLANKQERPLDKLGRFIGGIVLLVSFIGLLCIAVCKVGCKMGRCGGAKPMHCEYAGKSALLGTSVPAADSVPAETASSPQ